VRTDPPFPFARQRAAGELIEIRADQLAFDLDAARELLTGMLGPDVPEPLVVALHERTEGWAAGLRLAGLALRRGASPDELDRRFTGSTGTVAELLVSEVLDRQDPAIRRFLQDTSALTLLDPDLCDAVTGRSDSRSVLRSLAAEHAFIAPLDADPDRYRHHTLLGELLRFEFQSQPVDHQHEVHRRAAHWHAARDEHGPAMDHAFAADDPALAATLLLQGIRNLNGRRRSALLDWLDAFDEAFAEADPGRAVELLCVAVLVGAPSWVRWRKLARRVATDDHPRALALLHAIEAIGAVAQGRHEDWLALIGRARERWPEIDTSHQFAEFVALWELRWLSATGRHAEAVHLGTRLVGRPLQLVALPVALGALARALLLAGQPERARTVARQALDRWAADGEPDLQGMVDALATLSSLEREAGALDEAERLATVAVGLSQGRPPNALSVWAHLELAAVTASRGLDPRPAIRPLHEALLLLDSGPAIIAPVEAVLHTEPAIRPGPGTGLFEELTRRELDVLRYLDGHLSFPQIARELYVSRHTVKTHVLHLYRKLGVASRSEAVDEARRLGLLPLGR
jgi:LuxR family transcriptional regulator, maltose regulon positive regulatory protein